MQNTDSLLERIPHNQLKSEQVARWWDGGVWPTFKLLREPNNMNEFAIHNHGVAIWMENGTLTYISSRLYYPVEKFNAFFGKNVYLEFHDKDTNTVVTFTISGQNYDAIADTAAYFWSLGCSNDRITSLTIDTLMRQFDFSIIRPNQIARIFENTHHRALSLVALTMSAMQSVVLATRPHPITLSCGSDLVLEDSGRAFVDALQNRQSSFGSLELVSEQRCHMKPNWDHNNIRRLFQTRNIDKLAVEGSFASSMIPAVFTSPINEIYWHDEHDTKCQFVRVQPKRVSLALIYKHRFPSDSIYAFLRHLNHVDLTRLHLLLHGKTAIPDMIIEEIARFIAANQNLEELVLVDFVQSSELVRNVFRATEANKKLRVLRIREYPHKFDPAYSWLKQLLTRNRHIEAVNKRGGGLVTDGLHIDRLYSLNRFYRGLTGLGEEEQSIRPSLVGTILIRNALNNFQRSALLLADHTDTLCELIQFAL